MVAFQHPYVVVAPAETVHVTAWPGTGKPVAVIPGLFGGSFTFRKVIPLLAAQGFRPIVIEPLGTGFSSRPLKADYSLAAQSQRIAAVLDSLKSGPVLVLAHSLGAAMAFRLAIDRPDLVRGIVSIEGGPTEEATTPMFRSAMRYLPWVNLAMSRAREPAKLSPRLGNIACPVTLVVGTAHHDGDVPPEEVALMTHSIPSFEVDSQQGAGHYLQEERPTAVVAAVERLAQRAR